MKIQEPQKEKRIRWQVISIFMFSWLCHSVSAQLHYSIPEEMRKDSVIENIAKDLGLEIKQLSFRKFRIVSRVSEKYFTVNVDNGNLYIKDRIDRETLCGTESPCILTFDAVAENPLNVLPVTIEILDVNDNSPNFFHDILSLEILETTTPGTHFILQNAEDPDIGNNSVQTYKLSDNQHFTLSEKTSTDGSTFLELVLEKPLDRETQNIHELILTAIDGGKPIKSGSVLINIAIADVNDNFPIFTQKVYKVSVSENTPINSTLLHVTATDQDEGSNAQITYSFRKTSGNALYDHTFSIDANNGEIRTRGKLDFEALRNYEIPIQAKDGGGLVAHSKVLVEILDENDNAPEISITSLTSPILEDSLPGTLIALIEVHDRDSGDNGEIDCKIIDKLPFQLVSSSSKYFKIITTYSMDREKEPFYSITILANDRGSPSLSTIKSIRLDISDVNDNPPVFQKSTYVAYVPENNLPGASIYSIQASDIDSGDNAKVTYSISTTSSEEIPISSYLSMNIETGVLYAQRSFDYEQYKEFQIQVIAKDYGSPPLSNNASLIIHIMDQNDNAPRILFPSPENDGTVFFEIVPFGSERGSLITKVVAVDADSGHNAWLSYNFIHGSEPSPFSISQHTGEIRTAYVFEQKDVLKYKAVVLVKDNGIPSLSATVTLSFIVAESFQQVVPKFSEEFNAEDSPPNLQMYLVTALALISFLFILSIILVIVSKFKDFKSSPTFGSLSTNLYPPVDPRILSQYNSGTLPLPYSYNVCVALDSSESDFTLLKPQQNLTVDNLLDAVHSGLGDENMTKLISAPLLAAIRQFFGSGESNKNITSFRFPKLNWFEYRPSLLYFLMEISASTTEFELSGKLISEK
uniref:Cadherin domain-containing protein n=1 Tax=Leptobrachium leishanense TaxID=445787 RepID=A0A8C5QR01_9ANUR